MRERQRTPIEALRRAVAQLPRPTRVAMLEGISANQIIAGAYIDADGICPMLAAHRAGGRTRAAEFALAWDRFVLGDGPALRRRRARRASPRELAVLRSHLQASLIDEEVAGCDLAAARAEHERLAAARAEHERPRHTAAQLQRAMRPRERPGDPDRSRELCQAQGWAWTGVVRSLEDYERALERLDDAADGLELWAPARQRGARSGLLPAK